MATLEELEWLLRSLVRAKKYEMELDSVEVRLSSRHGELRWIDYLNLEVCIPLLRKEVRRRKQASKLRKLRQRTK